LLAGKRRVRRHHSLSTLQVLEHEPLLERNGLKGGASYFDAATDDAGLTIATVMSAVENGAVAVDYARMDSITKTGARADGAMVQNMAGSGSIRVSARVIVSATGPWQARGTKGSHVMVPRSRVGNRSAVTLVAPQDGRVMFVLPSGDHAIIGTTDIFTEESPDDVKASDAEIDYLLASANYYFPDSRLTRDDIVETWAGIRPLAAAPPGANPSSISREHQISRDSSGVIIVTGGKLTTYRSMAAEIVDEVEKTLRRKPARSRTDEVLLPAPERVPVLR
jgi:glycerol-3-phosphate dehydrogenase